MQHGKNSYLFGLLCELHLLCAAHTKKRSNSTPQDEVTFNTGHRLHSVLIVCKRDMQIGHEFVGI